MLGADTRLTILQHVPVEPPGRIAPWALEHGLGIERIRLWADDPLPDAGQLDALVVLGGPMSVDDETEHPWLADEKALVREAVDAGAPVLGVCLGAQLIADALGGNVAPMKTPQIGVFDVETTPAAGEHPLTEAWPARFAPLHWHGDRIVELPDEATLLATSKACQEQAFAIGDEVLGLQFHLELEARDIGPMIEAADGQDALGDGDWVQPGDEIEAALEDDTELAAILADTLDAWAPDGDGPG